MQGAGKISRKFFLYTIKPLIFEVLEMLEAAITGPSSIVAACSTDLGGETHIATI